jgi:hypothetical protein
MNESNQWDLSIYKNLSFWNPVPYSFLRKDIKIYLPKTSHITFENIHGNNIKDISNLYFINSLWEYQNVKWMDQCSSKTLVFDTNISAYICTNSSLENSSGKILEEIDMIMEREINEVVNK